MRGGCFARQRVVDIAVRVLRMRCAALAKAVMMALFSRQALAHAAAAADADVACAVRAAAALRRWMGGMDVGVETGRA